MKSKKKTVRTAIAVVATAFAAGLPFVHLTAFGHGVTGETGKSAVESASSLARADVDLYLKSATK